MSKWILWIGLSLMVSSLACSKTEAPAATSDPSAKASASPLSAPEAPASAATGASTPRMAATAKAPAAASGAPMPAANASVTPLAATDAGPVVAADAGGAPVAAAGGANDEIPKPCQDSFGRLGKLTFSDGGGGTVKIASEKSASAKCKRLEPTRYECAWTVDGKSTGSFPAKLDPAKKSVNGTHDKGKMWSCPPSSQR